jgi:hypothetical protein
MSSRFTANHALSLGARVEALDMRIASVAGIDQQTAHVLVQPRRRNAVRQRCHQLPRRRQASWLTTACAGSKNPETDEERHEVGRSSWGGPPGQASGRDTCWACGDLRTGRRLGTDERARGLRTRGAGFPSTAFQPCHRRATVTRFFDASALAERQISEVGSLGHQAARRRATPPSSDARPVLRYASWHESRRRTDAGKACQ